MEPKWLDWAKQLQSAAQAGLAYSKDIYDIERFEEIRKNKRGYHGASYRHRQKGHQRRIRR